MGAVSPMEVAWELMRVWAAGVRYASARGAQAFDGTEDEIARDVAWRRQILPGVSDLAPESGF